MAVYFTSSVPHGNTEEVSTARIAQYDTRTTEIETDRGFEKATEHVVYVPNIGEFSSIDLDELHKVFSQITGRIGVEQWKITKALSSGNSGSH